MTMLLRRPFIPCVLPLLMVTAISVSARADDEFVPGETEGLISVFKGGGEGCSFSPDAKRAVAFSSEMGAVIFDADTGKAMTPPLLHGGPGQKKEDRRLYSAVFSPDGTRLLTTGGDRFARVWDAFTGKPVMELPCSDTLSDAKFSPDGTRIVAACDDGTIRIWDARTAKLLLPPLQHSGQMAVQVSFSPDGRQVLTEQADLRLWDAATGQLLHLWEHSDRAKFSPDGKRIATMTYGPDVHVWNVKTGELVSTFARKRRVDAIDFSPDSRRIATGQMNVLRVWDAASGKPLTEPIKEHNVEWRIHDVVFSPDGKLLATGSYDFESGIWDVSSGKKIMSFSDMALGASPVFSHDGSKVVVAGWYEGVTCVWKVPSHPPVN